MKAILYKSANFVKNHLIYIIIISVLIIIFLFIIILNKNIAFQEEEIIPEIITKNGGLQPDTLSNKPVKYFNPKYKDIFFKNKISLYQKAIRYMNVEGHVKFYEKIPTDYYRSIIFEIKYFDSSNINYYFLPVIDNNKFFGFIYFKEKGRAKVTAYIFYDSSMSKKKDFIKTTATLSFIVDVVEAIPQNLTYLLPTKNVDCGNYYVRKLAEEITRNCKTNYEKAKSIYEYLVFGDNNYKMSFKKYKKPVISCRNINYYNTYIASQVITQKGGVCNDFSEIYAALLRAVNIKVKKVYGFTNYTKSVGHMWNIVDLTGDENHWIKVDASWANVDKNHYKKWADFYPDFEEGYFENMFKPYSHSSFSYDQIIEY